MANKVIGNISKKTLGSKVDTVADYIDLMSQMVAEYFNQRYKIKKRVEDIKKGIVQTLYDLKAEVIRTIVEAFFIITGLIALVAGMLLLLSRILPLEYVLIGYGLVVTILVLLRMKVKV